MLTALLVIEVLLGILVIGVAYQLGALSTRIDELSRLVKSLQDQITFNRKNINQLNNPTEKEEPYHYGSIK